MSGLFVSIFDYLLLMYRASHVEIRQFIILLGFEIASLCRLDQTLNRSSITYVLTQSHRSRVALFVMAASCSDVSSHQSVYLIILEPKNSNSPSMVLWCTGCVSKPSAICGHVYSGGLQKLLCFVLSLLQLPLSLASLFLCVGLNSFITLTHNNMRVFSVHFSINLPWVSILTFPAVHIQYELI